MNRVTLVGHVGNAPELNESKGTTYARFSLATNESWNDKDGNRQERTDWHQVIAFNGLAKTLSQLGPGDLVAVDGKLRADSYEKEGEKRRTVRVLAQNVEFLKKKARAEEVQPPTEDVPAMEEDDIPF